jgi:hypothetical protein
MIKAHVKSEGQNFNVYVGDELQASYNRFAEDYAYTLADEHANRLNRDMQPTDNTGNKG